MRKEFLLEVCCGSADDVIEAYHAGADRVELNSDLFHGGLTPSVGSQVVVKERTDSPIMTMIRPREGGFCYTDTEYDTSTAINRPIHYGGCLYPPEDRFAIIDGAAIKGNASVINQ